MIVATVYVHGYRQQINWAEWRFLQLPSPGDVISLADYEGKSHFARVRYTTYVGEPIHSDGEQPRASIVADWAEPQSFL